MPDDKKPATAPELDDSNLEDVNPEASTAADPETTETVSPTAGTEDAVSTKEDGDEATTSSGIETEEINDAVDDIVREEADMVLDIEDDAIPISAPLPPVKRTFRQKIAHVFSAWWENRPIRYGTLVALSLLSIATVFIPGTRYGILNALGVRVESSMKIIDSQTQLPLRNIPVRLQDKEQRSDEDGNVYFTDMKLGSSQLVIDKKGYAVVDKEIVLGWGSNPLGEQTLTATGTQYIFVLSDWMSGKPVLNGEATSGEDTAETDQEGKITLTIGEITDDTTVSVKADGYREEVLSINDLQASNELKMVPSKKHAFVSNRSGSYDLYKIDVDGKNEQVLLASSGKEREIPFVLSHPTNDTVAFISSRDGERNRDGFVLDGLFVIDALTGETQKVTRSEQLQVLGWSGQRLIYVAVVEGTSAGNEARSKIFSYNVETTERVELATSNYFNDARLINDVVYYSVSSYAVPLSSAKLFSIGVDGKNKKTIVDDQVWSIIRPSYETLLFNAQDQSWYEQKVGSEQPANKLSESPVSTTNRLYTTSPDAKRSAWVDVRDGKGVLLVYDVEKKEDVVVLTAAGLSDPVFWVDNNHLIYRVSTGQETADYIVNLEGGEPRKISDVSGNRSRYFGF